MKIFHWRYKDGKKDLKKFYHQRSKKGWRTRRRNDRKPTFVTLGLLVALSMVTIPASWSTPLTYSSLSDVCGLNVVVCDDEMSEFVGYSHLESICNCESDLTQYNNNGTVLRGRVNRKDVGICQINENYHLENSIELGMNIYTTQGNVDYAKYLYDKGGSVYWEASKPCWDK